MYNNQENFNIITLDNIDQDYFKQATEQQFNNFSQTLDNAIANNKENKKLTKALITFKEKYPDALLKITEVFKQDEIKTADLQKSLLELLKVNKNFLLNTIDIQSNIDIKNITIISDYFYTVFKCAMQDDKKQILTPLTLETNERNPDADYVGFDSDYESEYIKKEIYFVVEKGEDRILIEKDDEIDEEALWNLTLDTINTAIKNTIEQNKQYQNIKIKTRTSALRAKLQRFFGKKNNGESQTSTFNCIIF